MDPRLTPVILGAALLLPLLAVLVYSVALQRKAVGTQDSTVSKVDESLALARRSVQRQKEDLALLNRGGRGVRSPADRLPVRPRRSPGGASPRPELGRPPGRPNSEP